MQSTPLSQFLLLMENLYAVAALALVFIVIRVLFVRYRQRHPLPVKPGAPAVPHDWLLEMLEMAMFIPAIGLLLAVPGEIYVRVPIAIAGYFGLTLGARRWWQGYRKTHPLPAPAPATAKDFWLEVIDTCLIAVVLVFGIVRPFLMSTYFIPTGSMQPTLLMPHEVKAPGYYRYLRHLPIIGPRFAVANIQAGGDKLIANRFILRFRLPRRGEVIVFDPPAAAIVGNGPQYLLYEFLHDHPDALNALELSILAAYLPGARSMTEATRPTGDVREDTWRLQARMPDLPTQFEPFIKRVIGLPGDHIRIDPARGVFINGQLLPEAYLPADQPHATFAFPAPPEDPGAMPHLPILQFDETNPAHQRAASAFYEQFVYWLTGVYRQQHMYPERIQVNVRDGEFIVPPDTVFMMGDNRSKGGSFDSRYWGVVPRSQIKARAVSTFWPLNRLKLL